MIEKSILTAQVDLRRYDNRGYDPGRPVWVRALWYVVNALLFRGYLFPSNRLKLFFLCLFGARVGAGVVIKPNVNVKYPWHLNIGNAVWIGEGVWLDNLATISLGDNVCVSQQAYLLTGNHDYKDPKFGLIVEAIDVQQGAWIGARAVICPGVTIARHAVISVGSVLRTNTKPDTIYQGNPAVEVRQRQLMQASSDGSN